MPRILVLYHSSYGHIETMARAVVEGAGEVTNDVTLKRVPETMPEDVARQAGMKLDQEAPVADPMELADYDGILFGAPTRYGTVTSQMRSFIDQTGSLWAQGLTIGKVGSVFTSTATQHGGQESTILTFIPTLLHLGMVVVGLPYAAEGQMRLDEITGGSPYGASTIAAGDGSRWPTENELELARFQGRHVAGITAKLAA